MSTRGQDAPPRTQGGTGTIGPEADLGEMLLRPVRAHHAFESCVEQLATGIRLGVFPHGTGLPPERELAERMGVSRATLREAIAALRSAGMVHTKRGRGGGTVVDHVPTVPAQSSAEDSAARLAPRREELLDTLVFRRVVEPGACFVAACRKVGDPQREFLQDALAEVSGASDASTHRQADSRLHLAIASLTESPKLIRAVTEVQADLHDMLQAIPVLPVNIEHSNAQHRAIVEAILAGNASRARRAMESHCDDTAALIRGLLG
jgi:GntR family transcriptional regulator, transcriptional repressor for pyruvate dehydrogenase complex